MSNDEDSDSGILCQGFALPNGFLFGDTRIVGSMAELPPMLHNNDTTTIDIDMMFVRCNVIALPNGHPHDDQHVAVVDICTDGIHPGFARLRYRHSNEFVTNGRNSDFRFRMPKLCCCEVGTAIAEVHVQHDEAEG